MGKKVIIKFNDFRFYCSISIKYLKLWLIRNLTYVGIITSQNVIDPTCMTLPLQWITPCLNHCLNINNLGWTKIHYLLSNRHQSLAQRLLSLFLLILIPKYLLHWVALRKSLPVLVMLPVKIIWFTNLFLYLTLYLYYFLFTQSFCTWLIFLPKNSDVVCCIKPTI